VLPNSTGFFEGAISTSGVIFRYLSAGSGPTVVVLRDPHRFAASSAHQCLAQRSRVVLLNVPAAESVTEISTTDFVQAIGVLLDRIQVEQFHLIGEGTTAAIAVAVAVSLRKRVQSLVLQSPIVLCDGLWLPGQGDSLTLTTEQKAELSRCKTFSEAIEWAIGDLDLPILVLIGIRSEFPPVEAGRGYKAAFKNAWFFMVYAAGPHIDTDRPDCFSDVVGDFMRRGPKFTVTETSARLHSQDSA
jgi:pimeloyl-ACP methyl ester carboxylesterase